MCQLASSARAVHGPDKLLERQVVGAHFLRGKCSHRSSAAASFSAKKFAVENFSRRAHSGRGGGGNICRCNQ